MDGWITSHLHEDPTVVVSELSRTAIKISGASSVFEWKGLFDEITTTLVYAFAEGNVYEIAPSALNMEKADDGAACNDVLESFLTNLRFSQNASK